jgi:hypothetical protein
VLRDWLKPISIREGMYLRPKNASLARVGPDTGFRDLERALCIAIICMHDAQRLVAMPWRFGRYAPWKTLACLARS